MPIWAPSAISDVDDLYAYLSERNPRAADKTVDLIEVAAARLERFPELGRIGEIPGTREWVVSRTKYILIYRVRDDDVEIARVHHTSRRWPPTL